MLRSCCVKEQAACHTEKEENQSSPARPPTPVPLSEFKAGLDRSWERTRLDPSVFVVVIKASGQGL